MTHNFKTPTPFWGRSCAHFGDGYGIPCPIFGDTLSLFWGQFSGFFAPPCPYFGDILNNHTPQKMLCINRAKQAFHPVDFKYRTDGMPAWSQRRISTTVSITANNCSVDACISCRQNESIPSTLGNIITQLIVCALHVCGTVDPKIFRCCNCAKELTTTGCVKGDLSNHRTSARKVSFTCSKCHDCKGGYDPAHLGPQFIEKSVLPYTDLSTGWAQAIFPYPMVPMAPFQSMAGTGVGSLSFSLPKKSGEGC